MKPCAPLVLLLAVVGCEDGAPPVPRAEPATAADATVAAASALPVADPTLRVGAFVVPVPPLWEDVSTEAGPGAVGLRVRTKTPPVLLRLSASDRDATAPTACRDAAARMGPSLVGAAEVIALPAGKACRVHTMDGDVRSTLTALYHEGRGFMATCRYGDVADLAFCDDLLRRIERAPGDAAVDVR